MKKSVLQNKFDSIAKLKVNEEELFSSSPDTINTNIEWDKTEQLSFNSKGIKDIFQIIWGRNIDVNVQIFESHDFSTEQISKTKRIIENASALQFDLWPTQIKKMSIKLLDQDLEFKFVWQKNSKYSQEYFQKNYQKDKYITISPYIYKYQQLNLNHELDIVIKNFFEQNENISNIKHLKEVRYE